MEYLTHRVITGGEQEDVCDSEEASVRSWSFATGFDLAPPAQRSVMCVRDPVSVSVEAR